ncbi:MAG: 50S ribosomal protein L14 [Candidatus Hodgkinia cicadicola]|nr:MAG: 50S ribosomal protein L14 [Candidatus Hodgkinia cicadicola]
MSAIAATSGSKYKEGKALNAIVVRTAKPFARQLEWVRLNTQNPSAAAVVLLTEKLEPVGSGALGAIPKETKVVNQKVFSLASESVW